MTIKIGTNKHELTNAFVMVDGVKRQIIEIKVPTIDGNKSVWELKKEIPISELPNGSRVKHPGATYYDKDIVWIKLEDDHYGNNETTLLSEKIISLKAFDAKEPKNDDKINKYGNNRYTYSNIRQWLNSSEFNWYKAQHSYDAPPIKDNLWNEHNPYELEKGFIVNLTTEFRSTLLPTNLKVLKNDRDGGGLESCIDIIFLLSCTEVGLNNDTNFNEGTKFNYFKSNSDRVGYPTKEAINNSTYNHNNLSDSKGWNWWLRTSRASALYPEHIMCVFSSGSINKVSAYSGSSGIRPACTIPKTTKVSAEPDSDGCYILIP